MKKAFLILASLMRNVLCFIIKKHSNISLVLCCILLHIFHYFRCAAPFTFNSDTIGYLQPFRPWAGELSAVRPALYCCFLSFCRLFGDNLFLYAVVLVQAAVFICVLVFFSDMLKKRGCHAWIVFLTCSFLCFFSLVYNYSVYPESFSISGIMLLLRLFDSYSAQQSWAKLSLIVLLVTLLILLKPVFLVVGIALLIMLVIRRLLFKDSWTICGKAVLSLLAAAAILFLYCNENRRHNHFFGISSIGIQQDLLDMYESRAYQQCPPSPLRSFFEVSTQNGTGGYKAAHAAQCWVPEKITTPIRCYEECPRILLTDPNVQTVFQWHLDHEQQKDHPMFSLKELNSFIREGKHTSNYWRYQITKINRGIDSMWFPLSVIFFAVVLALLGVRKMKSSSLLIFANLLYAGFTAAVVFRSPMDQPSRLMFPVTPILIFDLCMIASLVLDPLLADGQEEDSYLKKFLSILR